MGRSPRSLAAAKTRTDGGAVAVAVCGCGECDVYLHISMSPASPKSRSRVEAGAGGSGTLSTLYGIMGPVTTAREYERLRRRPRGLWPTMTANTDRFTYGLQNEWRRVGYQMPSQNKGFRARCAKMIFGTDRREFLGECFCNLAAFDHDLARRVLRGHHQSPRGRPNRAVGRSELRRNRAFRPVS